MKYLAMFFLASLAVACSNGTPPSPEDLKADARKGIEKLEGELMSSVELSPNKPKANTLIEMYVTYVNNNPNDEVCGEYIFKAGEIAMGTEQYQRAIGLFENVSQNYTNYDKVVEATYLIAFIYDNYLDQKGMAEDKYKEVIERYPRHSFAVEARGAINNLYLSDEELIKKFEEQNRTAKEKVESSM